MKKVLVVDDAPVDRMQIERILVEADCLVITAADGNEAIAKARAEKPAIIFMDVNMPGLDGFGATRKLSADPATKGIPVVFVTAKNQKADRVWAQMLGARGYVTKPYVPQAVLDLLPLAT